MSEQKWIRSSLRHVSDRLKERGHQISHVTVGRILRLHKYSPRVNAKKVEGKQHPDRNLQFEYIATLRQAFEEAGLPVISVDTKKKELIGNFKNAGQAWSQEAEAVDVHDFPGDAIGRAVPYGIYDIAVNRGFVRIGTSADTAEFAVDAICAWWKKDGKQRYPGAKQLLILADGGGSNNCTHRLWKQQIQEKLCDQEGLEVTVCHYPTSCSKWNPIEHQLFGPISLNWAGTPLRTWEIMLGYLRGTTTKNGLKVTAELHKQQYQKGRKVSDEEMSRLSFKPHAVCPKWNYTFCSRSILTGLKKAA